MTVTRQTRFPKSKKRRIQKKWARNPRNLRTEPDLNSLVLGGDIYCHPIVAQRLRSEMRKHTQEYVDNTAMRSMYGIPFNYSI